MTSLAPPLKDAPQAGPTEDDAAPGAGVPAESAPAAPRLWVHLGLLVLLLVAVLAVARPGVSTWDEGSYGSQADALRAGSWRHDYQFGDIDPTGRWFPIVRSDGAGTDWFPYAKHPLVPSVQAALGRVAGQPGYVLPSLLGVLGTAAAAWAVARRIRAGTQVLAFWLIASGPLIFHATIIWAHAPGAALAGLAVLGAVELRRGGTRWWGHLALCAGVVGVELVRSEGLLFALCLLGALGLDTLLGPVRSASAGVPVESDQPPATIVRRFVRAVGSVLPAFVALVVAWFAEQRWMASILGQAQTGLAVKEGEVHYGWLAGRLHGLWMGTLSGSDLAGRATVLPLLMVAVVLVVGLRRHLTNPRVLAFALGTYAAVMALLQLSRPSVLVEGLVPAWPLMVIGVVSCGVGLWREQRMLMLTAATTLVAIWFTQYPDGGVFQWGGRFLTVIFVPLAVMAAAGIARLGAEAAAAAGVASWRKTPLYGAVAVVAVVSVVTPVLGLRGTRTDLADTLRPVATAGGQVTVTTSQEMGRLMWRSDVSFLRVRPAEVDTVLRKLRDRGLTSVRLVASPKTAEADASSFGRITGRSPVGHTGLYVYVLVPAHTS